MKKLMVFITSGISLLSFSQKSVHYNLAQFLKNGGLVSDTSNHAQ